jgi:hypothetical protein
MRASSAARSASANGFPARPYARREANLTATWRF